MNKVLLIGGVGDGTIVDCLPGSATVVFNTPEGNSVYECSSARFVFGGHSMSMTIGLEHTAPADWKLRMIARALFCEAVANEVSEGHVELKPISGIRSGSIARGLGRDIDL